MNTSKTGFFFITTCKKLPLILGTINLQNMAINHALVWLYRRELSKYYIINQLLISLHMWKYTGV